MANIHLLPFVLVFFLFSDFPPSRQKRWVNSTEHVRWWKVSQCMLVVSPLSSYFSIHLRQGEIKDLHKWLFKWSSFPLHAPTSFTAQLKSWFWIIRLGEHVTQNEASLCQCQHRWLCAVFKLMSQVSSDWRGCAEFFFFFFFLAVTHFISKCKPGKLGFENAPHAQKCIDTHAPTVCLLSQVDSNFTHLNLRACVTTAGAWNSTEYNVITTHNHDTTLASWMVYNIFVNVIFFLIIQYTIEA